jgi:hypothetical protein
MEAVDTEMAVLLAGVLELGARKQYPPYGLRGRTRVSVHKRRQRPLGGTLSELKEQTAKQAYGGGVVPRSLEAAIKCESCDARQEPETR